MTEAVEYIRRMRGGAQAHLMRCADGGYYIVKFQNNPQHLRVLANELLGTRLAARLGLPTAQVSVVEVRQEMIDSTAELVVQIGVGRTRCLAGFQFGSRYPGDPREVSVHDFLPDETLAGVENLTDFAGMLVFDKWTCNTNGRQTIFLARRDAESETGGAARRYRTLMIDQGFCFNAGEWTFPDAPLRGLYARSLVYDAVRGMESFGPWLARLEKGMTPEALDETAAEVPPEWLEWEHEKLFRLLEQLDRRRGQVRELILEARKSNRNPFRNWR